MLGYLSLDIICSSKLVVFLELHSPKTVRFSDNRDLKIPRRDEPGRLPEVNLLNRACAEELENHRSAVLVSSRTSFHQSSRRVEDVSILLLFIPYKCSNRPYF